jgi:putative peptidoglycan lipid II flippase
MSIVRHFLSVGSVTLVSRLLGFVRDSLIAAVLGTGPVADAFLVAFRLPNLARRLFSEGTLNAAFLPTYLRRQEEGEPVAARGLAASVLILVAATSLMLTALGMIFAGVVVLVLAPGFATDPQKFEGAVEMTRVCLPYLACLSIGGVVSGLLTAHRRYLATALAPLALNFVTIAILIVVVTGDLAHTWRAGTLLSGAVLLSGFTQLALLVIAAKRAGVLPPLSRLRLNADVLRLVRLSGPALVAGGVAQLSIALGTIVASQDAGAVAVLYYADRVYQLPLGVVSIAVGTVLLPEMLHTLAGPRPSEALEAQNRSLEFAALLTVPAAVALALLGGPIVEVLFEHGAFGPQDTARTAAALAAFALGLPAFVVVKVLAPAFFVREDTRTPMWIGLAAIALNLVLALVLYRPLAEVGVALATAAAGWFDAVGLILVLSRRGLWRSDLRLERALPRIAAAALAMGAGLLIAAEVVDPWTAAESPTLIKVSALASLVAVGMVLYFGVAHLTRVIDLGDWLASLRRRRAPDILPPPR